MHYFFQASAVALVWIDVPDRDFERLLTCAFCWWKTIPTYRGS